MSTDRNTEIKRAESDKTYDIYLFFGTPGLWFDDPPFSRLDPIDDVDGLPGIYKYGYRPSPEEQISE